VGLPKLLGEACAKENNMEFAVHPIGVVRSSLTDRSQCPHQGSEGAPEAWIELDPEYAAAIEGLEPGTDIMILTWMHLADRSVLRVHLKGDPRNPVTGVFNTRSADRPNPIGLHRATIVSVEPPNRLLVKPLEVVGQTPIVDIKCVLAETT
jgi:tRNA-Thr(GGU) m(6)t(6)A37 methyltransferase TsaA